MDAAALLGAVGATKWTQARVDAWAATARAQQCGPLRDLLHAHLPNLSRHERLIDLLPLTLGILVALFALFGKLDHANVCRMLAVALLLRCITMSVTLLPSPICTPGRSCAAIGGCHDCIFSGHTAMTLLLAYALARHFDGDWQVVVPLLAYSLATSALVVMTRAHYTVDVVVAWVAAYAVVKAVGR